MKKNKHSILVLVFAGLFFQSKLCISQQRVNLSEVDLIVYNEYDTDFRLYVQKENNQFIEIYLEFHDNEDNFITVDIEENDELETLEKILYDEEKYIYTKDLKETSGNELRNKELEITETKESWYKNGEDDNKLVLRFLTKHLCTIQEFYFGKRTFFGGFGSYEKYKDDAEEKWRTHSASHYSTIDLDFGNNKHIFLLNDGDSTDFMFLPLMNNDYLISDDDGISGLVEKKTYQNKYEDTFNGFEHDYFYTLQKNKEDGYRLLTPLKEDILGKSYDTIVYNQYFILAKKKDKFSIFNSYAEKLEINTIKSAYLYKNGIEVLSDLGANYFNSEVKIIDSFPPVNIVVCGSVGSTSYEINYDKNLRSYTVSKNNGGFTPIKEKRIYLLEGIKKNDEVTFLNGTKEYYWDNNDFVFGSNYGFPHLLKISRKNKSGIYEYEYHNSAKPLDTLKHSDWETEVRFMPEAIEKTTAFTIVNDSIVLNDKDGLIYFYDNKKSGIYPRHKTVQYDNIQQKTNSFYAIIRDNKKGWLDIKTNIEYFD